MHLMKTALLCSVAALAYASNPPGWKMDGDKLALDSDGNPIFIDGGGREASVKGDTIANLQGEAKQHRTAKEKAETELGKFRDEAGKLIDPEAAKKALDTVGKIDAKTLIDAGQVDEVRNQIKAEYETKIGERDTALTAAQKRIDDMRIDAVFKGSEFINERVAVPRDFFEAAMRGNFKIEDDKIAVYDRTGNRLMSKKTVGEFADPEEALALLVDQHPQKETILKAQQAGGTGNTGQGGSRGQGRVIKRVDFEALGPFEQAQAGIAMGKGELQIVD